MVNCFKIQFYSALAFGTPCRLQFCLSIISCCKTFVYSSPIPSFTVTSSSVHLVLVAKPASTLHGSTAHLLRCMLRFGVPFTSCLLSALHAVYLPKLAIHFSPALHFMLCCALSLSLSSLYS